MTIKPEALTYTLYVALLIAIIASTWVVRRSPDALNWVGIGLAVFVGLMVVVVAIFTKKTAPK